MSDITPENLPTVTCHCGHRFRTVARIDYAFMVIRSNISCPLCGGVRFTKLSWDKEIQTVTLDETGNVTDGLVGG